MFSLVATVMLLLTVLTSCVSQPKTVPKYCPVPIPASQCVTDYIRNDPDMPDCMVEWLDKIAIQQSKLKDKCGG